MIKSTLIGALGVSLLFGGANICFAQMLTESQEISELRVKAEGGDTVAQYRMGGAFLTGQGVPVSDAVAAQWFRRSAEGGLSAAQYTYARMLLYGRGVEKNESEADKWYQKAAEQGHSKAQFEYGIRFANLLSPVRKTSRAMSKKNIEAYKWVKLATISDVPPAVFPRGTDPRDRELSAADALKMLESRMTARDISEANQRADAWEVTPK